ncbi:phosphoglycolate phosphatase, bacterial [Lentilactobacillus otakiensis DSM 19908 = JCM 15040]|nr:phosphoglycolate phosphatase, bacterial [Lentilactobacillus otakiensis DSM 19908 = JCM 15040]
MKKMINNYFFDFDKTLADSGDSSVIATKEAFKSMNLTVPDSDTISGYIGIPAKISFKKMAKEPLSDDKIMKLTNKFLSIYSEVEDANTKLFPGILDMLSQLKSADKKLYVVSSKKTDELDRNLKHLNIRQYFDDIVGYDLVTNYKPAPDGIVLLLKKYDLKKDESMMIGDAKYDIQMGQSAGVRTCGALWGAFDVDSLTNQVPTYLVDQPVRIVSLA